MITHDVREAVFLSQRIYVMTARTGTSQAEISIKLGPDRTVDTRKDPQFEYFQDQVTRLLTQKAA